MVHKRESIKRSGVVKSGKEINPRLVKGISFMQARSAVHDVFVKDYASCVSISRRHTQMRRRDAYFPR